MEFSEFFLNKLLEGAVSFYRNNKDIYVNPIPEKFKSIEESIEYFKNALIKEAHISLKNEIKVVDSPILHAVNLDTETPGIVAGETKQKVTNNEKLFLVFKKNKPKKEKTQEQIENDIVRAQERELKKQLQNEKKEIIKEALKKEKDEIKENKEVLKNKKKETNEAMQVSKEYKSRAKEINKKLKDTPNPDDNLKEQHKKINDNSDNYTKLYEHILEETLDMEQKNKIRENKIKKEAADKKQERLEKKEVSQKKKEENFKKLKKKVEEKEKKICEDNDENDMGAMDDLFDTLIEAGKNLENNTEGEVSATESLVNLNNVKLYESPLPFQRHIDAMKKCEPNNLIKKSLLDGSKTSGDSYIKLIHGPPGTGKTYNLIKELKEMIDSKNKHKKILICAPSNIATINLYERAVTEDIDCSLVISTKGKKFHRKDQDDVEDINKKVIFSTVSMSTSSKFKDIEFTSIMMDEASQCQEAWFWGLLRPTVKYIYMTGDPHQLPALVSKEGNKLNHQRSFMDRMISLGYKSILLDTQRRMHPEIVEFSNFKYYDNKLSTDYTPSKKSGVAKYLKAFEICNTEGVEQRVGTSYQNLEEANMVINLYNELQDKFEDIVVISPYNAQCNLLRSLEPKLKSCIHSVDSYQGKESDVIILTTVRTENLGFWSDYRRLNVAMTRAKHILRIVGNVESWNEGPLNDLKNYYKL